MSATDIAYGATRHPGPTRRRSMVASPISCSAISGTDKAVIWSAPRNRASSKQLTLEIRKPVRGSFLLSLNAMSSTDVGFATTRHLPKHLTIRTDFPLYKTRTAFKPLVLASHHGGNKEKKRTTEHMSSGYTHIALQRHPHREQKRDAGPRLSSLSKRVSHASYRTTPCPVLTSDTTLPGLE
eukprot:2203900-Rhodomonas_salina.2